MNEDTTTTIEDSTIICLNQKGPKPRGIFYGDSPFNYATSVLYMQLSVSAFLTSLLQRLLNPLGESAFISQMLVGILLGPTVLGDDNVFVKTIFPRSSFYVSETFAFFGCMLFMFLVGVKMDVSLVMKSGKRALAIGLCCFFVPLFLTTSLALLLRGMLNMEPELHKSIISIAFFQSSTSFYVTACLLTDLKLLNSELGRLAVSSSMISGTLSWILLVLAFMVRQSSFRDQNILPYMSFSLCFMLILIVCILRPIMRSMVKHTARGRAMREKHIFSVFVMVLCCSFLGEFIGLHFTLGPMILGLAVPDGPPLGSALVDKLDSYVSSILLPGYFVFSGASIDLYPVKLKTFGAVWLIVVSSFFSKLVGAMVPSLMCKMPMVDALSLGLVLSAQGITDILIWQQGMLLLMIDQNSYSIMVVLTVVITGTITPIVKLLYDPSKKYASNKPRTIEHAADHDSEFRLVVCIHHQENAPSVIRLLEISNPTTKIPLCFYVVHLIQLSGRSTPLLITHRAAGTRPNSLHSNHSDHIISAFHQFEEQHQGKAIMSAITAMAPCASMHDEVCSLALEKRACMVIIPFHKHYSSRHGDMAAIAAELSADVTMPLMTNTLRTVNLNILRNAPCSVGILVERGAPLLLQPSLSSQQMYSVGMIFVEGPDDREALAYAIRMAEKPNVSVTVVKIRESGEQQREKNINNSDDIFNSTNNNNNDNSSSNSNSNISSSKKLDSDMIEKFKVAAKAGGKKRHFYKEKSAKNGVEMINVVRSMENSYDLILVGRRHSTESALFVGLTDWNEFSELGYIGDVLTSTAADDDCEVSVLVVQQQTFEGPQFAPNSPKYHVVVNNLTP